MADGITFDSSEVVELTGQLQQATTEVRDMAHRATALVGAKVKRDAQILAPVDTGFLRSSITARTTRRVNDSTAEITASANYAEYVEYGTSRMSPQPFMTPAFERNKQPFIDALQQLVDGALG